MALKIIKSSKLCQADKDDDTLLTYNQVAYRLSISVSKLKKDVRLGRGPSSVKIGRARRFRRDAIEEFIEECSSEPFDGDSGGVSSQKKKKRNIRLFS